ncbi:MAG: hypothetical protein WD823_02550 [Sulfuricaulis sp.]|uniref:hypothetical protein n=1 Tax=Sulfuricaulis sp. TaxID=2003553 RepID=UPI0034A56124
MNKEEASILHGLYYYREIVEEEVLYSAAEINWLVHHPISKGKEWRGTDGKPQSVENETDNYLATIGATSAAAARPLAYLQASGSIRYRKDGGGFRIAVTGTGADLARELDTCFGRLNVFYKTHKDGVLWFVATVLLSLVTTLVTLYAS